MKKTKLEKQIEKNRKQSMTKKALAEYNKKQRSMVSMNTGTRTHKSAKDYNRQAQRQATKQAMREAC